MKLNLKRFNEKFENTGFLLDNDFSLNKINPYVLALVCGIVFFLIGIFTFNDYGLTTDEPFYFNEMKSNIEFYKGDYNRGTNITELPWLTGVFGQPFELTSYVMFYEFIPVFKNENDGFNEFKGRTIYKGEYDAYHFGHLLTSTAIIILLFLVTFKLFNKKIIAILSVLFIFFIPRFLGHTQNNPKDIQVLFFMLLSIYILLIYNTSGKKILLYILSAILAIGFTSKVTMVMPIIAIGLFILIKKSYRKNYASIKDLSIMSLIFILVLHMTYPILFKKPIFGIFDFLTFIKIQTWQVFYFGKVYLVHDLPWHYIFGILGVTLPFTILLLSIIGFIFLILNFKKENNFLILLILGVSFVFFMIKGAFDLDRYFIFLYSIIAICSAIAVILISSFVYNNKSKIQNIVIFSLMMILILLMPMSSIKKYHPYESYYFNELIGGTIGASSKFRVAYWEGFMKEVSETLNEKAKSNSVVAVINNCQGCLEGSPYLKNNITFTGKYTDNRYVVLIYSGFIPQPGIKEIKTIKVDGLPIVTIMEIPSNG